MIKNTQDHYSIIKKNNKKGALKEGGGLIGGGKKQRFLIGAKDLSVALIEPEMKKLDTGWSTPFGS